MAKFKFVYDRRKTAGPKKTGSVELRITYNYKQKFMATGVMVYPKQWDAMSESVKGSIDAVEINGALMKMKQRAVAAFADMAEAGAVDLQSLCRTLGNRTEGKTFLEYILERIEAHKVREGTTKRYKSFYTAFRKWGGIVTFPDITEANIRKMDEWLKGRRTRTGEPFKQSTIHSYHKHLRQFINDAVVDGHLQSNPYNMRRIHIDRGEREKIESLTESQVKAIESLCLKDRFLSRVRDLFLFQCFTGLAYMDMMSFNPEDYAPGNGGTMSGTGKRTKTGSTFL